MNPSDFPCDVQPHLVPRPGGDMVYKCLGCDATHDINTLLYTCPSCNSVLLIEDRDFDRHRAIPGPLWRKIFDFRKSLNIPALKGVYRFHEFIGPDLPLEAVVWLGEGGTPVVEASPLLQQKVGIRLFFKNDGQNPSASFKDRGMASAFSRINFLLQSGILSNVLAVCASTGDTSASAALYAAYLKPRVTSAVLLPHGKVTPQQLSQPLGNGAAVFEIAGVFDDCMKVVEELSENYNVALLNSKNAWRILGQESYSYEIAQDFSYDTRNLTVVVPIGNAGNITAVMNGFLKFFRIGIINALPKIIGVQSDHASPVFQYYREPDPARRRFAPVTVKPSVAQAAMIGNPVSMPRVIRLADRYDQAAGQRRVFVVEVSEQQIMDWQLTANRHGNIVCTHGGESLAGLVTARQQGLVTDDDMAVLDSTAHMLKFSNFQQMYFENAFPAHYGVTPDPALVNAPQLVEVPGIATPADRETLSGPEMTTFVRKTADEIANRLGLKRTKQ
ncbi:threonine synthase [Desulfosudis oleivorans]|uniref:Threonine synthase n=1 Tax=Desulfosudis oleivorans (strain DSM 6200 / JCM 39069 / Hxd3) TaxID=96561 RepID=A8ZXS2_DESOH|nr:threonine synthase [Desulfosudis oleivorans]ABW68549.1 threonine synthase [Desulfosudis oleivorans Hxd3]